MQNLPRNLIVFVALALAIAFGVGRLSQEPRLQSPSHDQTHAQPHPQSAPEGGQLVWSHGPDGSVANAQEHWRKHGSEFPEFHSEQDYVAGAMAFVTNPPQGTLIKHDDRGNTLFYDPATNTFAVRDEQGEPRTFFRPDNGRAYWDRQ